MPTTEQLQKSIESLNLVEDMEDDTKTDIASKLVEWFDQDEGSRTEWVKRTDQWTKLAVQVVEKKSFPWTDAANVKYPMLTTAAMQFAARAYPALVPGPNLVKSIVVGKDPEGRHAEAAERIGKHMSYQLLYEMKGWEEDMDRLCIILPILGCVFKKTYYDSLKKNNVSELIHPKDLVIDYYAKSIDSATRVTHKIELTNNQIYERIAGGVFSEFQYNQANSSVDNKTKNKINGLSEPSYSPATPHLFLEVHTWWDLDEDGYDEPYIFTIHYESRTLVRAVARFDSKGIVLNDKNKIIKIEPIEYFTKFGFIPNPDGSIYDLGFGLLLGGINETVNTLTNQLLDSGTLNNLQAGFLGKGLRVRAGNSRFQPGEWKPVDFTGDDIKKHIFALPTKEPSETLFKLLETLVTSGKELASVSEIFVGKMPGQNTPATTTMATIEQGMKVFTAIYKRVYRSLNQEYAKLYRLNSVHLDEEDYFTVNGMEGGPEQAAIYATDYSEEITVKPNADPNVVSDTQKLLKAQSLQELMALGTLNPAEVTKRILEAQDQPNIQALMQTEPPPPPLKEQAAMIAAQAKQADVELRSQQHADTSAREDDKLMLEASKAKDAGDLEHLALMYQQQKEKTDQLLKLLDLQTKESIAAKKRTQSS